MIYEYCFDQRFAKHGLPHVSVRPRGESDFWILKYLKECVTICFNDKTFKSLAINNFI